MVCLLSLGTRTPQSTDAQEMEKNLLGHFWSSFATWSQMIMEVISRKFHIARYKKGIPNNSLINFHGERDAERILD